MYRGGHDHTFLLFIVYNLTFLLNTIQKTKYQQKTSFE